MTQIIIDIQKPNEDWVSHVGEISMTSDMEGRIYIEVDDIEIGLNLPDLMIFLQRKIMDGVDAP